MFEGLMRRAGKERSREVIEELARLAGNRPAAGYTSSLSSSEGEREVLQALRASSLFVGWRRQLFTFTKGW